MSDEFEKPNKIDALEQKLYSPRQDIVARERRPMKEKEYNIAHDWNTPSAPPMQDNPLSADRPRKNWFLTFLILSFIFFLGALGYVGYKFYFNESSLGRNVDILVNAPIAIGAGEIFAFDVLIENKNSVGIETVDIEVEFPDGTRSPSDIGQDFKRVNDEIDPIASGSTSKSNYSALLFGEEGDKKEMIVRVQYRVEGSSMLLEKEKVFDVVLKSTPVRLTVTNVKELTSGQNLSFTVELVSNSTQRLENVMVQATYPFGFKYQKSSFPAKEDGRTWIIPKIEPKETITFTIDGVLEGQNNEERYFSFIAGLEDNATGNPQVVFNTKGTTVTLARPFLELELSVARDNSEIIVLNPDVVHDAMISFKNNTSYPLRNVSLDLSLEGASLNKGSVQVSEGFYQSAGSTITWDTSTSNRFVSFPIGTSSNVSFSFMGLGIGASSLITNPELIFTAQVQGNRNPDNQVPEIIENSIVKKIRFITQANLKTTSLYQTSPFENSGPLPPKVEQRTSYTAKVELSNTSNKIENGMVVMKIPTYVTYENEFSPSTENFSYDPVTRTLAWDVGTVPEKTGYAGNPARSIQFQVSILPSISQAGTTPNLVTNIEFTGDDTFAGTKIVKGGQSISTATADSQGFYDSQVSR